jgi:hypothetical protein
MGHKFLFAQNPIVGNIGVSDPHIRVFNDTVYLYSGHDSGPQDTAFIMKDWRVFSTTDLVNWTLRTTITPRDNYMDDNSIDCWAGDAASRNDKYYFYFSDYIRGIGVMESASPAGPFKDALDKPLVIPMHDPTILIDDDKDRTPYMVFGNKETGGYRIVRLNDDMISLAEQPRIITIKGDDWVHAPFWQDKNYLFKYKDIYYLSWGRNYATSKNVYGPYECAGGVGRGFNLNAFAHGSFFWWKGQFYHLWCYYLKNPKIKYRATLITYCHFDNDGKIVTDTGFLDQHFSNGVGQYNASWPKIEAEWYYEVSPNVQKKGSGEKGFVLSGFKSGDWVRFANTTFDKNYFKIIANVAFAGKKGRLEIRTGKPDGKLLGTVKLPESAAPTTFHEIACDLSGFIGKTDVYLVFKGDKKAVLSLDWFRFQE